MQVEQRLMTEKDAARYLALSTITLRKWRFERNPDAPAFIRAGARAIRYDLEDLDAWLTAHRFEAQRV